MIALGGCGTLHPSPPPRACSVADTSDSGAVNSGFVHSLQRQLQEREKRIAELEAQLDALKVIDQDMEKLRKPSRSPATLTPIE